MLLRLGLLHIMLEFGTAFKPDVIHKALASKEFGEELFNLLERYVVIPGRMDFHAQIHKEPVHAIDPTIN